MSFPVVLHGPEGQQFATFTGTTTSNPRWPLGTQLIVQDGRKFRFAQAGATALVAGDLQQAAANVPNHVGVAPIGFTDTTINNLNSRLIDWTPGGATAAVLNYYAGGYVIVDTGPGNGYMYLVDSHLAIPASTATVEFNLAAGHALQVAFTSATRLSAISNPYKSVIISPTTITREPVGVAIKPLAISAYGWLQTRGAAAVAGQGTLVIGDPCMRSTTTAGAIAPVVAAAAGMPLGWIMRVAATTLHQSVFLSIDG